MIMLISLAHFPVSTMGVRRYVLTDKMFSIVKMLGEAESIYLRLKRSSYFVL